MRKTYFNVNASVLAFVLGLPSFTNAAELTEREKQLRECIPLLATIAAVRMIDAKIPDSPRRFAEYMVNKANLFGNPLFVYATLQVIKPGKIKDLVRGKLTADDISADTATKIWTNFLKNFDAHENDKDKISQAWINSNSAIKGTGEIDFESYKLWQQLAKEFVFEPYKTDIAIAFIRAMMPNYLIYLDNWYNHFEVKREITGFISWVFKGQKASSLNGIANKSRKTLVGEAPAAFESLMGEKDLLYTTLEQFKDTMLRIVDTEKLKNFKAVPDLTDSQSASTYGTFFNPLAVALSDALMSVQQSHLRNVDLKHLRDQFPDGKLPARADHIDMVGLNKEIENERAKITETHAKIEHLFAIENAISDKVNEYINEATKISSFTNERVQMVFLAQVQNLQQVRDLLLQIKSTTKFVMDTLQGDRAYLNALGKAVSQAHMGKAMETEEQVKANVRKASQK